MKKRITIKEAIELGLITDSQLRKKATELKLDYIQDLHNKSLIKQTAELFNAEELSQYCHFAHYWGVNLYIRDPEDLHLVRAILRKQLGTWTDKLDYTYVNGEDLEVTYLCTLENRLLADVKLHVSYSIHDLPAGLLKSTCKVVENTEYSIQCDL
jgi:hypothetical protein